MSTNDQQGYMESAKDKISNAWESTKETAAAGAQKVADKALDAKDRKTGVNRDNSQGAAKIEPSAATQQRQP
ncbi:Late embryogenesis abundant protein 1 [Aphelenchoides avenae]|nr:Late embryogenesis abundant protein 1 [Aphelenchus avenae]